MKKIQILESVRGFAAIYVLLTHFLPSQKWPLGHLEILLRFGQEAVMLFFLLSGFVIYYSVSRQPQQSFKEYFRRRALRIYPIYILSLLIAYLAFCLNNKGVMPLEWTLFLGNLFMLQDFAATKPGVWFNIFSHNAPLWSLAYEWWFYMMFFPIFRLVDGEKQKWLVGLISLVGFVSYVAFPNQIGLYLNYFIIWWAGVEVSKIYASGKRPDLKSLKATLGLLVFFAALHFGDVLFYWKVQHQHPSFGMHPILELRHFSFSLLVLVAALGMPKSAWNAVGKVLSPFGVLAPISYAIYVLHYPLCAGATYLSFIHSWPLEQVLYLAIAFSVAYLAEVPFQRFINRISKKRSGAVKAGTI